MPRPLKPKRPQSGERGGSRRVGPRRRLAAGAVALSLIAGAAILLWLLRTSPAEAALQGFVELWSRGDDRGAARLTDEPRAAAVALQANRRGLDGARLEAEVLGLEETADGARGRVRLTWHVPGIGPFSHVSHANLRSDEGRWRIRWAPAVVHPGLAAGERLGTVGEPRARGEILDRRGRPLMSAKPVKRMGVVAGEVEDPADVAQRLSKLLGVEPGPLKLAIRAGGREQFVEAVALRLDEAERVEEEVEALPGGEVVTGTAQLAPIRAFGRAVLGAVGPVTSEQLEQLGDAYAPTDEVGQWGLQRRFDRQLRGRPRAAVVERREGVPTNTLLERPGRAGRDLKTTIDRDVQTAAERALGHDGGRNRALVAVQPSTGDVLAVANRPTDDTYNRAFEGTYPPGSTFKVVTTSALIREGGLTPDTPVDCPRTRVVGGRLFRNFEGRAGGVGPFRRSFAESCNTAFVGLSRRLKSGALSRTARSFGLGREIDAGLPAFGGRMSLSDDRTALAAAAIGQDGVLASPISLAVVAATVADGRWRGPRLLPSRPAAVGPPVRDGELRDLRILTRQVVTEGTAEALADVPGEVHGKTGTAEYGQGDPPPTHAWFVGYRGDLALAVLVEGGRSGGEVAAPIARRFLGALEGGP